MSSKPSKGAFTKYSITGLVILLLGLVQEFASLILGNKGGAYSHMIWAANAVDGGPSWRWALVSGPLVGFFLWMVPHTLWAIGDGSHLLVCMAAVTLVLAVVVLLT